MDATARCPRPGRTAPRVAVSPAARPQDRNEALRRACARGDVATARGLVAQGADVNAADGWRTPLLLAVQAGRNDLVAYLLAKGARFTRPYPNAALLIACSAHHPDTAAFLLTRGAPLEARGMPGMDLLVAAADADAVEVLTALLDRGTPINAMPFAAGQTALHRAIASRSARCIAVLLQRGAAFDLKDVNGKTPLMVAAEVDARETMRRLLDKGADPEAVDDAGRNVLWFAQQRSPEAALLLIYKGATPRVRAGRGTDPEAVPGLTRLRAAAQEGDFARVRALVRAGATLAEDGPEVLVRAAGKGDLETVRFLVARGVPLHAPPPPGKIDDTGALGAAARAGQTETVRYLLAHGPWPQSDNTRGPQSERDSLLVAVAAAGFVEVARLLLDAGFDPNVDDGYFVTDGNNHAGRTPLLAAAANGRVAVAGLLLDRGVKVNAVLRRDVRGEWTALTVAAQSGNAAMVRFLVRRGADPTVRAEGKTPAECARAAGHAEVAALLEGR